MTKAQERKRGAKIAWLNALTNKSIFWWMLAAVFYAIFTLIIMGDVATSCSTSVFGYPGDGTGGIAWFQWADGGGPIWGFTDLSNYPSGEQLNRPSFITAYGLYAPYSIISMLTNQVCGLNIMTALGFMTAGLTMFGLVRWLTKINSVALFAGFAAAFIPYHQLQAQGHLSYIYSSIFIAIIWAFLWFMRKPNLKRMLLIVVLYAFSLYCDGYFILMSTALVAILFLIFIFSKVISFKVGSRAQLSFDFKQLGNNIKNNWKIVAISMVALLLLLVPIAYKQLKQGSEIQSSLSNSRSNIHNEAMVYGAHLEDFFLPTTQSILVDDDYTNWRSTNIHGSNVQESTLYIGYAVLALGLFVVVILLLSHRVQNRWGVGPYRLAIGVSLTLIVILTLFSLPPYISIGKLDLATPTLLLIEVTEKWRVLSRLFMITHAAMVILAAIGLAVIVKTMKSRWKWAIVAGVFIVTIIEFYPATTPNWSYETDTPSVYHEMAKDPSISVVAEYPITDHPSSTLPYTHTFQQTHGKKMLNANNSNTDQRYLRQSIAGLSDAQTIGVLKQLGVDTVTTLGVDATNVFGLITYKPAAFIKDPSIAKVYSYRLANDVQKNPYALVVREGFSIQLSKDKLRSSAYMTNVANMSIDVVGKATPGPIDQQFRVSFTASAHEKGAQSLEIKQHDKVLWSGVVQSGEKIEFTASRVDTLRLLVPGHYNTPALYIEDLKVSPI